ncbi:DUF4124 domain-containing protein [Lysobacter sp. LF1]|uniref:DUF4124 domain-containing protein n=1 Tax=Lysobacter stagni TaxID=3045172 RepID=A0ABT6XDY9_9GAMM|nr:DUF4124 domain-containing protein [Lysobacter sp. LF1]MDI9238357.1 DUF4124 domain-containing protein [Lysobacter sp. LF1]
MRPACRTALTTALPLLLAASGVLAADITIYRCTDAQGHLTLRDTPCRKGETQQTKEMQRPKDAPPSRAKATAKAAAPEIETETTLPPTHYVVMKPPRPMYECVTPDNRSYLSDTSAGNPRWVPLWTLGYPTVVSRDSGYGGGVYARVGGQFNGGDGRYQVSVGDRPPPRPPEGMPPPGGYAVDSYGAGTWVYDECHALPQEEVCARLRDERWNLGRRYNSALQSERQQIDQEQRGIDARLASDCGGA